MGKQGASLQGSQSGPSTCVPVGWPWVPRQLAEPEALFSHICLGPSPWKELLSEASLAALGWWHQASVPGPVAGW